MEKKMLLTFYNFTQKNERFGSVIVITTKASPFVFALIYILTAVHLIIRESVGILLYTAIPAATLLISIILRYTIRRPRPYLVLGLDAKYAVKKSWSFPSNHSASAGIIAFSCMFVNIYLGIFVFLLAILTGLTRIFTGAHYPTDVIGGFILSGILAIIGYNILPSLF